MLKKLEKWYVVVGILLFAGGLIPVQRAQSERSPALDHINSILQACVFAIFAMFMVANSRQVFAALSRVKTIMAICLLATASSLWSINPVFTFRRTLIFWGLTLFTIYFAERFSFKEQVDLMYAAIVFEIFATLATAILLPKVGISGDLHAGAWKGLFIHKNNLGQFMGFSILFLLYARPSSANRKWRAFLLLLATAFMFLSHSATPVLAVVLVVCLIGLFHLSRIRKRNNLPLWIGLAPFIVSLGILLIVIREFVLTSIGKDATLTGRLPIWSATLHVIADRLFFGYGYASFWETKNIYSLGIRTVIQWPGAPHAHNGYIDTLVDLGLVGLSLFLCIYASSILKAARRLRNNIGLYPSWPIAYILFYGISNLTESSLVQSHKFLWLPFVWITCELAKKPEICIQKRKPTQVEDAVEEAKVQYA